MSKIKETLPPLLTSNWRWNRDLLMYAGIRGGLQETVLLVASFWSRFVWRQFSRLRHAHHCSASNRSVVGSCPGLFQLFPSKKCRQRINETHNPEWLGLAETSQGYHWTSRQSPSKSIGLSRKDLGQILSRFKLRLRKTSWKWRISFLGSVLLKSPLGCWTQSHWVLMILMDLAGSFHLHGELRGGFN